MRELLPSGLMPTPSPFPLSSACTPRQLAGPAAQLPPPAAATAAGAGAAASAPGAGPSAGAGTSGASGAGGHEGPGGQRKGCWMCGTGSAPDSKLKKCSGACSPTYPKGSK
jgi:DNA polymerase-3 subunit gamma/tau